MTNGVAGACKKFGTAFYCSTCDNDNDCNVTDDPAGDSRETGTGPNACAKAPITKYKVSDGLEVEIRQGECYQKDCGKYAANAAS